MQDVKEILSELGFSGIEDAAKKHAWLIISGKVAKYDAECNFFETKYKCDFITFEKNINSRVNEEDINEEDDLLDWRFAFEQLTKYREQIALIQS
ncbi:MAG: hypothetical protein FJ213_03730 [Ignavibacteria bacterium]|nr:hypothetical protein [Ignavibacteria bacterium]